MTSEPFARPLSELIHEAWSEESDFWMLSDEEKQDWLSEWETLAVKLESQAGDLRARIETLSTFEWGFSDSISKQAVLKLLDQAATPSDDALLKGILELLQDRTDNLALDPDEYPSLKGDIEALFARTLKGPTKDENQK